MPCKKAADTVSPYCAAADKYGGKEEITVNVKRKVSFFRGLLLAPVGFAVLITSMLHIS
jgi:hypothetical protein